MGILPLLTLLIGCQFHQDQASWHDQLRPDSPCYRVDLFDGLDESSTDELQDLFACIDQGNFVALRGLMDAMDEPARSGDPAGVELARLVNHLPAKGLDLAAILDATVVLLRDDGAPLLGVAELAVEFVYGYPYDRIAAAQPSADPDALDQGLLVPALPLLADLSSQFLTRDDGLGPLSAQALRSETSLDLIATFLAVAASDDERLAQVPDELLVTLGDALEAVEDASNDHAADASGNSLRDVAQALVQPRQGDLTALEQLLDPLDSMLSDPTTAEALADALAESSRGGHLAPLPSQLTLLATEDIDGGSLEPGEDSALVALLRLLHTGDRPVTCSTIGIQWLETDNLSVWLLQLIADQEPDNVDFLLNVGGWTLSFGELVEALAGQCTVDSQQFASDAPALERLVDPEVGDLLVVLLELLQALEPSGGSSRIPELVELVSLVHQHDLAAPVEELLKDLAGTRLLTLLMDLVPPLVDPWSSQAWCANGTDSCLEETWAGYDEDAFEAGRHPLDFNTVAALLGVLLEQDQHGLSPLVRLRSSLQLAVDHPATWQVLHNGGALLGSPGARAGAILAELPAWTLVDPEWKVLDLVADLLEDDACTTPVLQIAETEPVLDALGATSEQEEGPLPFASRLVIDGTLAEVLATVKLILDLLLEARP
jgi:hypothetical protein